MTPNNELPVWPFLPNWRDGILERLSWATVVMTSETGSEQRYSSRLSPRREFEALFNPIGDARTFFDLFISELGGQEMMIPMWHDRHKLTSPIVDGDDRVDCDTAYGEFEDGGMAILIGADAWSHQVLEIDTVDVDGFTLAVGADFDWPEGALVLAMRRSRIDMQPTMTNLTNRVGEATIRFILNQANDLPGNGVWAGLEYSGYPVMTMETDWKDGVDIGFSRVTETEDNGIGLAFIRDIADRAFRTKKHTWHLNTKAQNYEFRQFLYRLGGRRSAVWMPTGNQDLAVAVTANAGQGNAQVRRVGLTYVGGPQPGRDRVLARTGEGYQVRRITGMGAPALPTYERVNFDSNLTYALPAGTIMSFLEIMRADGDDIELMHHTDTDGVTECSINFRSFNNARVAATPISVPLPSAERSLLLCGEPATDEALCTVYNPWSLLLSYTWTAPATLGFYDPLFVFSLPQAVLAGAMPNGRTLAKGLNIGVGSLSGESFNVAVPGTSIVLDRALRDNNNGDGSPGGPIAGFRTLWSSPGESVGIEYYFFFPISSDVANRHVHWELQFGAGSFHGVAEAARGGMISVTTGEGVTYVNFARNPQQLFPFSVDFDY